MDNVQVDGDFMPINKLPMAHRTTLVLWITINQHGIKSNQIKTKIKKKIKKNNRKSKKKVGFNV